MEGGGSTELLDYIKLLKRNRPYRLLCLSEVGWKCEGWATVDKWVGPKFW